jgi:hypothetical protein
VEINVPKIVNTINLSEYHPALNQTLQVWVNPPRVVRLEILAILSANIDILKAENSKGIADEITGEAVQPVPDAQTVQKTMYTWYSRILSQGPEGTRFTPEKLQETVEKIADTDPAFWPWLRQRVMDEISDHTHNVKKA